MSQQPYFSSDRLSLVPAIRLVRLLLLRVALVSRSTVTLLAFGCCYCSMASIDQSQASNQCQLEPQRGLRCTWLSVSRRQSVQCYWRYPFISTHFLFRPNPHSTALFTFWTIGVVRPVLFEIRRTICSVDHWEY